MQPRELRSLGVRALGTRPQTSSAPGLVLPSRRELCSREHATPIPPAASRCVFSRLARKRRPSPYKDEGLFVVPPYFAACAASLRRSDKRLIGNGITRRFLFPAAAIKESLCRPAGQPRRFQNLSSEATSASPSPNRSCSRGTSAAFAENAIPEPISLSVGRSVLLFFHAFVCEYASTLPQAAGFVKKNFPAYCFSGLVTVVSPSSFGL